MCKAVCRIADKDNTPEEQSFPVYDGVSDYNFYVYPPLATPRLLPNVLRVYSHLLGFDKAHKRFNLVPCDTDGRLYVTTDPQKNTLISPTRVTITPTAHFVLHENLDRKSFIISNIGVAPVWLFGTHLAGPLRGVIIRPGVTYTNDTWALKVEAKSEYYKVDLLVTEFI